MLSWLRSLRGAFSCPHGNRRVDYVRQHPDAREPPVLAFPGPAPLRPHGGPRLADTGSAPADPPERPQTGRVRGTDPPRPGRSGGHSRSANAGGGACPAYRRDPIGRAEAVADVLEMLRLGLAVPPAKQLCARWGGLPKQTASDWLSEMERDGFIVRRRVGRDKVISAGPAFVRALGGADRDVGLDRPRIHAPAGSYARASVAHTATARAAEGASKKKAA